MIKVVLWANFLFDFEIELAVIHNYLKFELNRRYGSIYMNILLPKIKPN